MSPFNAFIPDALEARLQDGIRHAVSLGAEGAEAFVSVSRSRKAKVQNGVLQDLSTSKRGGLGVRVIRPGGKGFRTGLATSTDLGAPDFRGLFAQAWELSALGDEDPWLRQADPSGADDLPLHYDPAADSLTTEQRIAWALDLEAQARKASPKVAAVREASWSDGSGATLLLTQTGVRATNTWSSCSASIDLAVADGEERQAAWHWEVARRPGLDLAAIGAEAALKGERKLHPQRLPAGRYAVVLHPEVAVELLGLVAGMLDAESVLKQRSLFAGKLGQSIASPLLTLVDDGRLLETPGCPALGTEPWDAEGLPTRKNILLEGGILKTYLHTLKTAAEMGQTPTATAGRGFGSQPSATLFNLFPLPGTSSPEAMYRLAGNGVLLTEIMGLHTVDPVSGDLSVGASGIRIRDGILAEPVDKLTFAGNLRDFLTRIVALGSDLRWYGGSAGLSILLEDISLGGA